MEDIYRRLCRKIDEISFGFPKSFIGQDKALIKSIFSKEDAENFLLMGDGFQPASDFAKRKGVSEEEAKTTLDHMASKGLIYRRHNGDITEYKQYPFVAGILEFQVKHSSNKKFLLHTAMYMISSNWGYRMSQTMPFERSVPLHKEFVEGTKILPFDDIETILNRHTRFAVAPCICRTMYKLEPWNPCKHPLETCITTDEYATFYIEQGIGREITREEAYKILMEGEKDGRVISISNSQTDENICSCCKCGCGMLYMKRKYPGPSADYWSNYYAKIDLSKCVQCKTCVSRCPSDSIKFDKKKKTIVLSSKSCLGCGLCVSTCPSKALSLVQKEKDKLYTPPVDIDEAMDKWEEITVKKYDRFN